MFRIKAIQVEEGDALLVSYGDSQAPRHLLIDGGPVGSWENLEAVLAAEQVDGKLQLEALVITHYDLDHIQGVIELLEQMPPWLVIRDVWFNGYHHVQPPDLLGSAQGDRLTALIRSLGLPWNTSFSRARDGREGPVIRQDTAAIKLDGELEVCVLSPDGAGLDALAAQWHNALSAPSEPDDAPEDLLGRDDSWPPGSFKTYGGESRSDQSVPNRSSIALLLTFEEKRMLLAADAWCAVVKRGLDRHLLYDEPIDLLKVSHHGSKGNTDRSLLTRIRCRRFLISTSGKIHKHPDHDLMGRLLADRNTPEIYFNYAQAWASDQLSVPADWPRYVAHGPADGACYVQVDL